MFDISDIFKDIADFAVGEQLDIVKKFQDFDVKRAGYGDISVDGGRCDGALHMVSLEEALLKNLRQFLDGRIAVAHFQPFYGRLRQCWMSR